jgi:hypothetical protein
MSEHNRRTADRKLRTGDWRTAVIVLTESSRHTLFTSRRKKS